MKRVAVLVALVSVVSSSMLSVEQYETSYKVSVDDHGMFAKIVQPQFNSPLSDMPEFFPEEPQLDGDTNSFLELGSGTSGGWKRCEFYGDLHTFTELLNKQRFEVMGEREWTALRGPLEPDGKPFLDLQVTQRTFQTENNMRSTYACEARYPFITVAKDIGIKCGENYLLYQAPKSTYIAERCSKDSDYHPDVDFSRFFFKGSLIDPNSKARINLDWEGYDPEKLNHMRKVVRFADGSGSVIVHTNICKDGCRRGSRERKGQAGGIYFDVRCGGDDTAAANLRFRVHTCCEGAFYSNVYANIPPAGLNGAKVTSGNLMNGFCGGWNPNTTNGRKWQSAHDSCTSLNNVEENRYYYKGSGDGLPGSKGVQSANRISRQISEFYTRHECIKSFIPYGHESIFRMFELGTKGKLWQYDAARWASDGKQENPNEVNAIDPEKMKQSREQCVTKRRKIDNRADSELDDTKAKDYSLLTITEFCAEDLYLDLEWSDKDMQDQICESVQQRVDVERIDIYCAQENLQDLDMNKADANQLGNSNATAVNEIKSLLEQYTLYTEEIKNSQDSIDYWDDGMCELPSLETKDLQVDCAAHKFKDTQKVEKKAD